MVQNLVPIPTADAADQEAGWQLPAACQRGGTPSGDPNTLGQLGEVEESLRVVGELLGKASGDGIGQPLHVGV
jgi:hypothetical protein